MHVTAGAIPTSSLLQRICSFRGESLYVLRLAVEYVDDAGEWGAASSISATAGDLFSATAIVCKSKVGTDVATRGDVEGGSGGGALDGLGDGDGGSGGSALS